MLSITRTVALGLLLVIVGCAAKPQADGGGAGATVSPRSDGTTTTSPAAIAKSSKTSSSSNLNFDPCATRLHDLCANLLLYYDRKQALPETIEQLADVPGLPAPQLNCPVSSQKYIYNPHGPSGPDTGSRLIIYDAAPHASRRWGIAVQDPEPGKALVVKTVVMPESVFTRP